MEIKDPHPEVIIFNITDKKSLKVFLPDKLVNLDKFTWARILYTEIEEKVILADNVYGSEYLYESINTLITCIDLAMKGEREFPKDLDTDKGICYYMNIWRNNLPERVMDNTPEDPAKNLWLWSTSEGAQTFLYNINSEIYIEISSSYKWFNTEPEECEEFINFEEFIKNYHMITRFKIDKNKVEEWKELSNGILNILKKNTFNNG